MTDFEPLNPETGEPLTELERVLWRFRMAAHEAKTMWRGFLDVGDVNRGLNDDLMLGLSNQCLLIVAKFREVWDDLGTLAEEDPRVVATRRAVQPLVDRIDIWPGLRSFRNSALAHAYTDRGGRLVPPFAMIRSGQAPSYHAEIVLLMQLVVFGVLAILLVFEDEYATIDSITRDPSEWDGDPGPGISLGSEIEPELRRISAILTDNLKRDLGVSTKGPLMEMFKRALKPKSL